MTVATTVTVLDARVRMSNTWTQSEMIVATNVTVLDVGVHMFNTWTQVTTKSNNKVIVVKYKC